MIQGANGSGKTLLAQAIAGKLNLKKGRVLINGVENQNISSIVRYVPARTFELLFNASCSLFYQQRYYSTPNKEVQTVQSFLGDEIKQIQLLTAQHEAFNISKLYDLKVTSLSNGQLRKLVHLKTIASFPKFIVLDYPYQGLDKESRSELDQILKDIVHIIKCSLIIIENEHQIPNLAVTKLNIDNAEKKDQYQNAQLSSLVLTQSTTKQEIIRLTNITVNYGLKRVLNNLNWTVNKGEKWILTGKNGSGKSTLLSLIFADHPQVYTNEISLFGKKRGTGESIWDIKNRISFLSAEMFTYAESSYKNNQKTDEFLLSHFHGPFIDEHCNLKQIQLTMNKFLAFFNLTEIKNEFFRNLSSGQKQLVLLIRTFLYKKELILLDEPFQFLDEANKLLAKTFIVQQISADDTLIVISHDKENEFPEINLCLAL